MYNCVTIVGCGNLGSYLANTITLKSLESDLTKKLNIIDNDIIERKNFPYIFQSLNNTKTIQKYIGNPKANLLRFLLKKLNPKLRIEIHYSDFKNILRKKYKKENELYIDCRDTSEENSLFDLKLHSEGIFGRIVINPTDLKSFDSSNYIMGISKFHSSYFSYITTQNYLTRLDSYPKDKRINILINLTNGKTYELPGKQTKNITFK